MISFLSILFSSFTTTEKDWDKIIRSSQKTFNISDPNFNELRGQIENHKYFTISSKSTQIGYLVIAQANSKHQKFDFYILFSNNATILEVRVLTYRENYGFEICAKRWLSQFKSIKTDNQFEYNSKIDGVSGATISVNSIKHEIFVITNQLNNMIEKLL